METWDLVVVGGGLAGLSAAVEAARAGLRVLVCERQGTPGGRAGTDRSQGFALNQGPHAIYGGGAAERALGALGVSYRGAAPRATGFALDQGKLHTFPGGPASFLLTTLLPAAAKWEVGRLMAAAPRLSPADYRGQTVSQVVDGLVRHPQARAFVRATMRLGTYCDEPDVSCGEAAVAQMARAVSPGVRYVEGGWQTLVDALAGAARQAGATLRTGVSVEAVEASGGGHAVRGPGVELGARQVLLTTGPRASSRLLGERSASLAAFAAHAVPLRGACLDVALSSVARPSARLILGVDRPVFGSLQSETVRLAPDGGGVVHLIRYLREGESPAPEHRAELEAALDLLQPGWRAAAVRERWLPAMVVAHARVEARRGGLGGRPAAAVPELPGVYVAGDWVGPEGVLLDASLASAGEAARQIVARGGALRAVA